MSNIVSLKHLLSFSTKGQFRIPYAPGPKAIFSFGNLSHFYTNSKLNQKKYFTSFNTKRIHNYALNAKSQNTIFSKTVNTNLMIENYHMIFSRGVKSFKSLHSPMLPKRYDKDSYLDDSEKDEFLYFLTREKKYKEEGKDFYIIRFPETFYEGELLNIQWKVEVGDAVKEGQLLFTLCFENDYELDIYSPVKGHLIKKFMEEGAHLLTAGKSMGVIVFDPNNIPKYKKYFKRNPLIYLQILISYCIAFIALLGIAFFFLCVMHVYYPNNHFLNDLIEDIYNLLPW